MNGNSSMPLFGAIEKRNENMLLELGKKKKCPIGVAFKRGERRKEI